MTKRPKRFIILTIYYNEPIKEALVLNNKVLTVALGPILTINSSWRMSAKGLNNQNYPCLLKKEKMSNCQDFNKKLIKSSV